MATLEKHIFQTWSELSAYLTSKGFTVANNKITWDEAPSNIQAYWTYDSNGTVNFHNSEGNTAFYHNLTDFTNGKYCGCIFIPLQDDGCILFLSSVDVDFDITNLQLCCINNYRDTSGGREDLTNDLDNGIVILTPPESDGYWRYIWFDKESGIYDSYHSTTSAYKWDIDNTRGIVTQGTEIPCVKIISANLTVTLLKVYLSNGSWSDNIYTQVLGEVTSPGNVFKIDGQKFISIVPGSTEYRVPVFKLPPEVVIVNPSTSTEEFSVDKTYKINDYCIYNGLLWKCVQAITVPGPFDQGDWIITTVNNELLSN